MLLYDVSTQFAILTTKHYILSLVTRGIAHVGCTISSIVYLVFLCVPFNDEFVSHDPQTHLPGYVEDFDAIKAKGVEVVACVAVNDAFVMAAWGESQGATGKVRMLADTAGEFTKVRTTGQSLLITDYKQE